MPKYRTKNALFWYFWTRILKIIVTIEINALEFFKSEAFERSALFKVGDLFFLKVWVPVWVRERFIKYAKYDKCFPIFSYFEIFCKLYVTNVW